jgi:hypothetical protein
VLVMRDGRIISDQHQDAKSAALDLARLNAA